MDVKILDKCIIFMFFVLVQTATNNRKNEITPCLRNYNCVSLTHCNIENLGSNFLYPCDNNFNQICCPLQNVINNNNTPNAIVSRTEEFPLNCGTVSNDDKIINGREASIGQFPWMALLGYKQKGLEFVVFQCGGSIITNRYVLTAAHCLGIENLELTVVRFGELNLLTDVDCEEDMNSKICADPHIDIPVEKIIAHQNYNKDKLKNDIAMVKVKRRIPFTEFIQPICLPFGKRIESRFLADQNFTVSGWGKTHHSNLGGANKLQFTTVRVWNQNKCEYSIPPNVKPLNDTQLCANGRKTEDACKGDSGGPLVNTTFEENQLRTFQIGIVSFASSQSCGNPELPTVYTRVDRYLQWIINNIS